MGRSRSFVLLLGVCAALLCLPGVAAAADFTWNLSSDFTTSAPGANPDKDSYNGHPWSYERGGGTRLGTFGTSGTGGLPGWTDSGSAPFVAVDTGAGHAVLQPSATAPAVVAWTSPLAGTVTVSGSVTAMQPPLLCRNATWALLKNGASTGPGGTAGMNPSSFSTPVSVAPGDRITLQTTVSPGLLPTGDCAETSANLTITAPDPPPAVTLDSPANGATITSGQPTFSGTADKSFGSLPAVTVRVYSGSDTTGTPVRTLPATAAGGSYSVTANPALPDGTYTAQTEQDSISGGHGFSTKNTFTLQTHGATITLNSLGAAPLTTAAPTFSGVAGHSQSVHIAVHSGATTDSATVVTADGSAGSDGTFSIRLPSLADGRYTAIGSDGAGGVSKPVTFRIKVHAPALTLTDPAAGGYLSQSGETFSGAAGQSLGDAPQVSVTLFGGATARAKNLGTRRATPARGTWTLRWPTRLALGTYTVRVSQADDAGHTTTLTHTFRLITASSSVGPTVDVSPGGQASVPLFCAAPAHRTCTGTVLIVTKKAYRAAGGGLSGRLRVMFAYVSIPGGGGLVVRRQVQADALRALRQARRVQVVVVATLRSGNGAAHRVSVDRVITVRTARHR